MGYRLKGIKKVISRYQILQTTAPELWNVLPYHAKNSMILGQFKFSLKTYLFTLLFCDN